MITISPQLLPNQIFPFLPLYIWKRPEKPDAFFQGSKCVSNENTGVVLFIIPPSLTVNHTYPFESSTIPSTREPKSCRTLLYILSLISNFTTPPPNVPTQRICCLSSQNRLVILFSILEWNAFSFFVSKVNTNGLLHRLSLSKRNLYNPFQVVK